MCILVFSLQADASKAAISSAVEEPAPPLLLTRRAAERSPIQLLNSDVPGVEGAANVSPLEAVPGAPKPSSSATSSKLLRCDDADGSCGKMHCNVRPRAENGSRISRNKYEGVNILVLCGLLQLLHIGVNQHGDVAALQSAYEGTPPHYSSLTAAAHVLDQ
ncbi:hypothetical protein Esti_003655 [Eimeria stiedai]